MQPPSQLSQPPQQLQLQAQPQMIQVSSFIIQSLQGPGGFRPPTASPPPGKALSLYRSLETSALSRPVFSASPRHAFEAAACTPAWFNPRRLRVRGLRRRREHLLPYRYGELPGLAQHRAADAMGLQPHRGPRGRRGPPVCARLQASGSRRVAAVGVPTHILAQFIPLAILECDVPQLSSRSRQGSMTHSSMTRYLHHYTCLPHFYTSTILYLICCLRPHFSRVIGA